MSFAVTTPQMREGDKTVTRRKGWKNLKPGTLVRAVVKGMGLKKGEKVVPIRVIEIVDVRIERLDAIIEQDVVTGRIRNPECAAEGFENMRGDDFVSMFCTEMRCDSDQEVTRIEFKHRYDLSVCCGAPIEGWPEDRDPCLHECTDCGKPCGWSS